MERPNKFKINLTIFTAIVIFIIVVISNVNYRLTPMIIYPLAPTQTTIISVKKRVCKGVIVNPSIYDTSISKYYIIEGYLSEDTSAINNAILTFLKSLSCVNINSKTLHYGFVFYKASWGFNKNFILEGECGLCDFEDNIIARVSISFGKKPTILYYHNSKMIYSEYSLNDSIVVREKFKDGFVIKEDRYMPNGSIVHKDLSHEWDSIMKEKDKY